MDAISGTGIGAALREVGRAGGAAAADGAAAAQQSDGPGFAERLVDAIRTADTDQKHAEDEARKLAAGKGDVVETMIGLTRADLSLRFVVQLRNRALEAYQEIMRLPL